MLTAARFLVTVALVALVAAPLAGCSQTAGSAAEVAPPERSAPGVVIAQLVTHDSKVSILGSSSRGRGGGDGDLRVVVRKADGTLVADGITLAELRTKDPDAYEIVTSSYVDATLDLHHLN